MYACCFPKEKGENGRARSRATNSHELFPENELIINLTSFLQN